MHELFSHVTIKVNDKIFVKDPESSDLGKKIITNSIDMIDEMGVECFTFRKLAKQIKSTEASVYRYFESKHKLLLYLISWYWGWMEYRLVFRLANIESPYDRLERAIDLLTERVQEDTSFTHINECKLYQIFNSESSKAYLTKEVDQENREGVFTGYKQLVARISSIILEINPKYKYPNILVSTVIEGVHIQRFFSDHLPALTNHIKGEDAIAEFYKEMVFKAIGSNKA